MPHTHRFHIPAPLPNAGTTELPPDEAHHAARVVRVRAGDAVELFDGQGNVAAATIQAIEKRAVRVEIHDRQTIPDIQPPLTLAVAGLHRDKAIEELVRRGVEFGVNRFVFFPAERSERPPKLSDKLRRMAVDTCKQCGRSWLPEFNAVTSLDAIIETENVTYLYADLARTPAAIRGVDVARPVTILVGPEGDFTDRERDALLQAGARPISLGSTTFRSEVAAVLAAGLVRYEQGHLGPLA